MTSSRINLMEMPFQEVFSSDFFTWFHFAEVSRDIISTNLAGFTFQPEGPKFHDLVKLYLVTDNMSQCICFARLSIARDFIDNHQDGPFARDVAKSFLEQFPASKSQEQLDGLVKEVFSISPFAGQSVTTDDDPFQLDQPLIESSEYLVFLGSKPFAQRTVNGSRISLVNVLNEHKAVLEISVSLE